MIDLFLFRGDDKKKVKLTPEEEAHVKETIAKVLPSLKTVRIFYPNKYWMNYIRLSITQKNKNDKINYDGLKLYDWRMVTKDELPYKFGKGDRQTKPVEIKPIEVDEEPELKPELEPELELDKSEGEGSDQNDEPEEDFEPVLIPSRPDNLNKYEIIEPEKQPEPELKKKVKIAGNDELSFQSKFEIGASVLYIGAIAFSRFFLG